MAKKGNRRDIGLECANCHSHNYVTSKNTTKTKDKLSFNKFCKNCRQATPHNEFKSLH